MRIDHNQSGMRMSLHTKPLASIIEVAAAATVVGVLLQVIPAVAAAFAVIWYAILIWESDTIRGVTNRRVKKPEYPDEIL